jgi:hypothetical protein
VYRAVHASASKQRRIRRVNDRIDVELDDVCLNGFEFVSHDSGAVVGFKVKVDSGLRQNDDGYR